MKTLYYSIMIAVGVSGTVLVWGIAYPYVYLSQANSQGTIMKVSDTNFSVNYTITNATILSIVNDSHNVITFNLQTKGDGYARMTMPRSVLEHKTSTAIETFGLFGADAIDYSIDKRTLNEITFSFPFKKNDTRIIMWLPNHKY